MVNTILIILCLVIVFLILFAIIIISKLFVAYNKLEKEVIDLGIKYDNLIFSVKEVIHEGYLNNDGRLKKNVTTRNKNLGLSSDFEISNQTNEIEI